MALLCIFDEIFRVQAQSLALATNAVSGRRTETTDNRTYLEFGWDLGGEPRWTRLHGASSNRWE